MTLHALGALALFAAAGIAAVLTIRCTIAPNLGRIQSALAGRGAF